MIQNLDGTSRTAFAIGGQAALVSDLPSPPLVTAPAVQQTALNAMDPTQTFLVAVRVGDAQQSTDAVNLETVMAMFASLGLEPETPVLSSADQESGLYEGAKNYSFAGGTIYG
jgi:hypothetical protein